jgi:hypothetical protein
MAQRTRVLILVLVLLGAVAGGLYYSGVLDSGMTAVPLQSARSAKDAAKPAVPAPPPPPPVALVAPSKPVSTDPGPVPVTLASLQLMPEKTQFAVGLPPLSVMLTKTLPIVQQVFKQDLNVQEELDNFVREMAGNAGITYEGDTTQALVALGVDPNQSGALFMNFSALAETASKAVKEAAAGAVPAEPEFSPKDLKVVLTLPLLDAAKTEELVKMGLALAPGMTGPTPADANGVTLNVYEGDITVAYFIWNNRLVVGTDLDMVKSAAARTAQPATFRYGTAACPAEDANELVAMVYGRDFIPVMKQLVETAAQMQPAAVAMAQAQFSVLEKMFGGETSDDPLLTTLSVMNDRVELRSRMDSATHPGMLDYMGLAEPLRLAPMLPEDTMAFISYRLNEQTKRIMAESAKSAMPPDNPKGQQISTYVNQGLSLLGDEITIGIGGLVDLQFPSVYIMVATSKPSTAQMLLGLAGPKLMETYNEVQINQITAVPSPIPLYTTFAGDALVISNNIAGMKGLIDRAKAKQNTNLFASQQPPLDPATPYYAALLLRTALYSEVLRPVAQLMAPGSVPEHVDGALVELNAIIRDLRMLAQLDGSWYDTKLVLSLAQGAPEAAASAPEAAPEAAPTPAPEAAEPGK